MAGGENESCHRRDGTDREQGAAASCDETQQHRTDRSGHTKQEEQLHPVGPNPGGNGRGAEGPHDESATSR